MKRKNKVACITFHLNPARRSTNMPGGALARPGAGSVCVRLPANPLNSVSVRKPRGLKFRKCGPGGRPGFLTESIINKTNNQTQSK